ncbi:MAG: hypothetical protein D6815_10105 [Candidatus Dadabacteria bacterium]|nr:MAG: hypothetical protein D6815_10105 [Candidatus Dadabacteria bacterium]
MYRSPKEESMVSTLRPRSRKMTASMKTQVIAALATIVSLLLFSSSAMAVSGTVSGGGGFAIPIAPQAFTDSWTGGVILTGRVEVRIAPMWSIVGGLNYSWFPLDEATFETPSVSVDGGDLTAVYGFGGMRLHLSTDLLPDMEVYGEGGAGVYSHKISDVTIKGASTSVMLPGDSETAFAVHVTAGMRVSLFYGELTYLNAFTDVESTGILSIQGGIAVDL